MELNEWLKAERGRLTSMAKAFGMTQSAVTQWCRKGVPRQRMRSVRDYTGGAVSIEEMLPAAPAPAVSANDGGAEGLVAHQEAA